MTKRNYTEQFKKDALAYIHDHPNLSISECARNLGINENTLHGWLRKARVRGEVHRGSGNHSSDMAKENARLKRELRDTKDALEILKKAISILGD
ncbi:MAG TPA: transposase [Fervidobacterium sp.]|jgi:transposase|nr:transposase [Fervidobacterium sp.]